MTGGVPVAILAVWERWRGRNVSFRFYVAVFLGFGFAAASVQTWREENKARMIAEQTIARAKERTATKAQLQTFYIELGQMIDIQVPKDISTEDFAKFGAASDLKIGEMASWILKNMGPPAFARFLDRTGMMAVTYPAAVNQIHNTLLMNESRYRQNVLAMIESSAWDK